MNYGVHLQARLGRVLFVFLIAILALAIISPASAQRGKEQPTGRKPVPETDQKKDSTDPGTMIVGGTIAQPGAWPWQARVNFSGSLCGGSLIATQWVLTAAHCAGSSATAYRVTLGDHDMSVNEGTEQVMTVVQVIRHPSYNSSTYDNDVALLKLSSAVTLNSRVQIVPRAVSPTNDGMIEPGDNSTVTGWGTTSSGGSTSNQLRQVTVPLVSNSTCNASVSYGGKITANMLCAGYAEGGKDSCQGDSGGPLVGHDGAAWRLIGVVSWGEGCARANKYGVYARVTNYNTWINGYVGSTNPTPTPGPSPTPVPSPTPAPTQPPSTGNVVLNGGFESGATSWGQSSSAGYKLIDTTRPRTGAYSAYLGDYNSGTDTLYQTVKVPSNGTLRYYWYMTTGESGSTVYDRMYVRVYSSSGSLLATLRTLSNASPKGTWTLDTLSLSSYAGQSVRIQFTVTNDSTLPTAFFVDDVTLQ